MSSLFAKVLTALIGGVALMLIGYASLELSILPADSACALIIMGAISGLVGTACLPQAQKSNHN